VQTVLLEQVQELVLLPLVLVLVQEVEMLELLLLLEQGLQYRLALLQ
jgi:hypothetical protein